MGGLRDAHGLFIFKLIADKKGYGKNSIAFLFCQKTSKKEVKKMIKEAIHKVILRKDLTEKETEEVMREILSKDATNEQIASFVTGLRMKGETIEEITGSARVFQDKIPKITDQKEVICLDREDITIERETILKTTGRLDGGTNIFSISTAAAFVIAGGGVKVAKTVRRSFSPFCGCGDVVEALGINLDMTRTQLDRSLNEIGICFIYEPLIQNGLTHILNIRRVIGIRTIFNLVDPLINPAGAGFQLLGVYDPDLTEKMAFVLRNLGIKRGLVFYGEDTLDEISITGRTKITEVNDDGIRSYYIEPEDFGMRKANPIDIKGGTKEENAHIILDILRSVKGPKQDVTVLNAAGGFFISGKVGTFKEGIEIAKHSIHSGAALEKYERLIDFSKKERTYFRNLFEEAKGHIV